MANITAEYKVIEDVKNAECDGSHPFDGGISGPTIGYLVALKTGKEEYARLYCYDCFIGWCDTVIRNGIKIYRV